MARTTLFRGQTMVALVAAAALLLAACSSDDDTATDPPPERDQAAATEPDADSDADADADTESDADDPAPGGDINAALDDSWMASAVEFRDMEGEQVSVECSEGGSATLPLVWGTDVYSDDSSICAAAVHAGVIDDGEGATVVIEIRPGEDDYEGSSRNGVDSLDWNIPWDGSFVVIGTE